MLEYSVIYHKSLREKVGSGVIAVPDDAATPHEDAADQARQHATEIGAVFFVMEMIAPIGTHVLGPRNQVFYTNYQGEEGPY